MYWDPYTWIVVVGSLMAFFAAYGIGANDVANAFASSVGSKALTLFQAVVLAGIFEFAGAVLLGSQVTDTIRKKLVDRDVFEDDPEILMFGMLCALLAVGIWLLLASYLELPVSTTHSIIGAIIGFGLVHAGSDAIVWYEFDDDKEFLSKFKGVVPVIASWFISPFLCGIVGAFLFGSIRKLILRAQNPNQRLYVFFPVLVAITLAVNIYFIVYKGFKRKIKHNGEKQELLDILGDGYASLLAWGTGILVGVIVWFTFVQWMKKETEEREAREAETGVSVEVSEGQEMTTMSRPESVQSMASSRNSVVSTVMEKTGLKFMWNKVSTYFKESMAQDLHAVVEDDNSVGGIHDHAEVFETSVENNFKYLQVFSAIMDSFAHGANDVANSIGPFAAIWAIYRTQTVDSKADVPIWILALGGAGIVAGLATYGYNIIRAIGVKLTKITPSRGFCIELSSATIIIIGSIYGIPLSTTHCQVGSTVGVGLLEGKKGVNGKLFLKVIFGWVITLVVTGFLSAAFFSIGVYSPSERCLAYSYDNLPSNTTVGEL